MMPKQTRKSKQNDVSNNKESVLQDSNESVGLVIILHCSYLR